MRFESNVTFDENPLNAARLYLALMAYPELGAGEEDQPGSEFTASLYHYGIWRHRRTFGLTKTREAMEDASFRPAEWHRFRRGLQRGLARVRRRIAVFYLLQRRMRIARGPNMGSGKTLADLRAHTPPWGKAMGDDVDLWRRRMSLNRTGLGGDDRRSKVQDIRRRAIGPSLPVIHMAYGLWVSSHEASREIADWKKRDQLLALYMNPQLWVFRAIEAAEKWRLGSDVEGFHAELRSHHMVELRTNADE